MKCHLLPILLLLSYSSLFPTMGKYMKPKKTRILKIKFFLDHDAVTRWKNTSGKTDLVDLETEIRSLLFEVQEIYKSMLKYVNTELCFDVDRIVYLPNTTVFYDTKSDKPSSLSYQYGEFFYFAADLDLIEKFDLAVLLTGHMDGKKYKRRSTINHRCTESASSVMEYNTSFVDAFILADCIATHFGSFYCLQYLPGTIHFRKDDDKPSAINYELSKCSARRAGGLADETCLKDGNKIVTGTRFGTLMTPDNLCQRAFGLDSFVDREATRKNPSDICISLTCIVQNEAGYTSLYTFAAPGMKCGKNKECIRGKCVKTSNGNPFISDSCPFGDQLKIDKDNGYNKGCEELDLSECEKYADACCNSCNMSNPVLLMTPDEVCKALYYKRSMFYDDTNNIDGDGLCSNMSCKAVSWDGTDIIKTYQAPDGLRCDQYQSKRCQRGKCVNSRSLDIRMHT